MLLLLEQPNAPPTNTSHSWLGSALASRSILITGTCPPRAALNNGVAPKGGTAWDGSDRLAPAFNKTSTDSTAPICALWCKWICNHSCGVGIDLRIDFDLAKPDGKVPFHNVKLSASFQISRLSTRATTYLPRGLGGCRRTGRRSMAPNQKPFDQTYPRAEFESLWSLYGLACQDSSAGWRSSAQVFSVPGTSWHFLMLKVRLMDDGKSVRLRMK